MLAYGFCQPDRDGFSDKQFAYEKMNLQKIKVSNCSFFDHPEHHSRPLKFQPEEEEREIESEYPAPFRSLE